MPGKYLTESEAREKMTERIRAHGTASKAEAEKLADKVVGAAFDGYDRRVGKPTEKKPK